MINIHESIETNYNKGMGYSIGLNSSYGNLLDVERYIKEAVKKRGLEVSFDVMAGENIYFKTINYTTYAGCITIHPLNTEQSLRQMYEAYADNTKAAGYIDYFKSKIESNACKYTFDEYKDTESKKVLVVLPGGNKLKEQIDVGSLARAINTHGADNVLCKKHPISAEEPYKELNDFFGGVLNFADKKSNLYDLMKGSEYVYSTLISESPLFAHVLGKKLGRLDLFQNRERASFMHINHFLYSTRNTTEWIERTFSSPKSGIINPEVDSDWKNKVDAYLDYILDVRSMYKYAYGFCEET